MAIDDNAASSVDTNAALMQLRMLHTIGQSTGNTIVLGWPTGIGMLRDVAEPKSHKADKT